ncbi:MAG TPA: FAD-dependent oxidoreductase [Gaiellaceae bacterium]
MAESFWLSDEAAPLPVRRLGRRPDITVIGAGVTGCACALALAEAGLRVRVHEAREVASGASGRNGGFARWGGAMPYDVARRQLGPERARDLWLLTERYTSRMESLAGDAFRRVASLRVASDVEEREEIRAEYEALRDDGFDAEWLDELPAPLDGRFYGGMRHPDDGAIHPARWVRRLARRAVEAGVEIRERSRVESLDELDADQVVLATDGYTHGLIPALDAAIRPTRGQMLATEPLRERLFPSPVSTRHGYIYWQQTPDRRLVIGGFRDETPDLEYTAVEETTPLVQGHIDAFVVDLIGELPPVAQRWSGIFGTTEDQLPLVGQVPGRDGLWVSAGYSGHGNLIGLACGELVAHAILGRPAPELALFDPARVDGIA